MRLILILVLVSGIACREHAKHHLNNLKDAHPAKKFNIVTNSGKEDSMMVVMKGLDGTAGQNGTQGDSGVPGIRGPPGPAGLKGAPGICTKEQCESTELKLLIQRVLAVEKYVKDKQNQTGAQPCVPPTPQVTAKPGVKICPTTPAPPQGSKVPPPQPPKAAAPPVTPPGQGQAGAAPAVPAGLPQKPNTPPVQPAKPAAPPVSSPVPVPGQSQPAPAPAVPAGSPQVLWGSPAPPPVATPLSSPIGLTIQSTLETPGTFLGGNGQVDIQGVVTPQVSVQGFTGNPGTVPATQRGTPFKKSSIFSKGAATKPKHVHKKSAVNHKTRAHKS